MENERQEEDVVIRHFLLRRKSLIYHKKFGNGAKVTESNALLQVIFHYWPQYRYCNLHFIKKKKNTVQ